jgi:hypothetical protein
MVIDVNVIIIAQQAYASENLGSVPAFFTVFTFARVLATAEEVQYSIA